MCLEPWTQRQLVCNSSFSYHVVQDVRSLEESISLDLFVVLRDKDNQPVRAYLALHSRCPCLPVPLRSPRRTASNKNIIALTPYPLVVRPSSDKGTCPTGDNVLTSPGEFSVQTVACTLENDNFTVSFREETTEVRVPFTVAIPKPFAVY